MEGGVQRRCDGAARGGVKGVRKADVPGRFKPHFVDALQHDAVGTLPNYSLHRVLIHSGVHSPTQASAPLQGHVCP